MDLNKILVLLFSFKLVPLDSLRDVGIRARMGLSSFLSLELYGPCLDPYDLNCQS
jgi:hypothetical protein